MTSMLSFKVGISELDRLLALDLPGLMAELRQNNIEGVRRNTDDCPVARLLKLKLGAHAANVGYTLIVDGKYLGISSSAMREFMRSFDKGMPGFNEFVGMAS